MNIGIGVLPYILLFFRIDYSGRLDAHSLPWVICLIVSVITFLGLVIFRGRALKNEIVKASAHVTILAVGTVHTG